MSKFIDKLHKFDAERTIKVARSMARISRHEGDGKHSNEARLQIARKSAKALAEGTRKKNRAISSMRKVLEDLDKDRAKERGK